MKNSIFIALSTFSLLSTGAIAQSSVSLYGIIDAALVHTTHQVGGTKNSADAGQLATSLWGIRGSEDLGGGLKANFGLEATIDNDTGASGAGYGSGTTAGISRFDRQATVGLSGGFGAVTLGRQNILGVDSIGLADPLSFAHAGSNPNVTFSTLNSGALYGNYGTNGGGAALRQNNSIKYLTPTPAVSGLGGALMYGFGEIPGNTSAASYAGASGYYKNEASGAALAYAKLKNATDSSTLTAWGGGAKYKTDSFALRATYAENKVDTTRRKIAVTGLGLDYAMTSVFTLTAAFYSTKRSGDIEGKANQYIALGKYSLSKRTVAYASLTHAKAGSSAAADTNLGIITTAGSDSANRLTVGILHTF